MELVSLLNSVSIGAGSKSNIINFAAEINEIHTEFVIATFTNQNLLIVTQYNKISTLYSVCEEQPENGFNLTEPVYTIREVFGITQIETEAAVRFIAEQLSIKKPTLIFFSLKNYDRDTVAGVVDAIKNYSAN